jgi:hypothetical protein
MLGGALLVLRAADVGVSVAHMVGLSYPFLAHLGDRQGTIDLVLSIGADGSVRSIKTVSGDGLLAGGAAKELKAWTFSPCAHGGGDCQYPMSVRFVLQGGPVNISECKTEFQFDNPGKIVVISQHARAIAD